MTKRLGWKKILLLMASMLTAAAFVGAQDEPASNMDILRDKIKADKKLLIAENLGLIEAESKNFWPIYEDCQNELMAINQRLGAMIQSDANDYNANTMTDAKAKALLTEAHSIDEAEVAFKKKYVGRLDGVIPAMKVARYL